MARESRGVIIVVAVLVAAVVVLGGVAGGLPDAASQEDGGTLFLPLAWNDASRANLEPIATAEATEVSTEVPSATATQTVSVPPTYTPLPTATPTATPPPVPSYIRGVIKAEGEPLPPGYGAPFSPQIELRLCEGFSEHECVSDEWEVMDHAVTTDGGRFVFENPLPLEDGDAYQVWWRNGRDEDYEGVELFLHRWWSRPITSFGPGDDVDVGVFEVADLKYRAICHDCAQSLPIVFKWDARKNKAEQYYWSLFKGCGNLENRYGAYRTKSLGHASEYELTAPPPGFRLNEKYCWYIFIEDGENGTGWPYHDWRVTFLPTP